MSNYTIEDLYKNAVKKKYEEVKNGDDHVYLNAPTRGKLNKLCWEIFETKPVSTDDKVVFNTLLGFPFDLNTKNKFKSNTNQFRPIETFLKGETDPDKIEVVDLAAILVDFQFRPFNKFRRQIDPEDLKLIEELRSPIIPDIEICNESLGHNEEGESNIDSETIPDAEESAQIEREESEPTESDEIEQLPTTITTFVNMDNPKSNIFRYLAIGAVFLGLGLIIYLVLPKKECIQWSGDHYEEVSCDLKIEGIGTFNSPEPYDERIINLRRIKVCDTTVFFKNEKAIVWYAKVGDSVEFFNTHGNHPENGRALRPVTQYILNKYLKK
ncbi:MULTISPECIES: hypothetical protein [Flavobacterium]|uniref:hypothetical protein n=1 Tax=Flavobacterium TaxID=237 RepID=UPI0011845DC8|nr:MULTISPECIES: hypothetical protein [Flavobacterium]MCR4032404.1 hypothetical protein [Flavobacterium panacis]